MIHIIIFPNKMADCWKTLCRKVIHFWSSCSFLSCYQWIKISRELPLHSYFKLVIFFVFVDFFKQNGTRMHYCFLKKSVTVFCDMIVRINSDQTLNVLDIDMAINFSHSIDIYSHHSLFPWQFRRFLDFMRSQLPVLALSPLQIESYL